MVELSGGARFQLEPPEPLGIAAPARRHDLHRDVAGEPFVPGPVDLAHASRAQRAENHVRAEAVSCGKCQVLTPSHEEEKRILEENAMETTEGVRIL